MHRPSTTLLSAACLFLCVGFAVYGASLGNGFVVWDDLLLIYSNPLTHGFSLSHIHQAFSQFDPELYIPATFLSYMFDYTLAGLSPWMYHLHNLLLHTANALLVCWIAIILTNHRFVALVTGLLFLVHPINVEAVSWAAARKDVLSTFWMLGAIVLYLYDQNGARGNRLLYILSVCAFAAGLLAKVMIIMLPAVLLLLDYVRRRRFSSAVLMDKVPYGILCLVFGIIAVFGKREVSSATTVYEKALMAAKSTVFYIQKIFMPVDFSIIYQYVKPIRLASPDFYVPVLLVALIVIFLAWCAWTGRRLVVFCLGFYLVTLLPTFINFAKGGSFFIASDRYVYVPQFGIFLLVVAAIWRVSMPGIGGKTYDSRLSALTLGAVAILAGLSWTSYKQSLVWHDSVRLLENAVRVQPDSSRVHFVIGALREETGDLDTALQEYRTAIALEPHFTQYIGVGSVLQKKGDITGARQSYQVALQLALTAKQAYFALGTLAEAEGNNAEAERQYRRAILLDDQYVAAYTNLGALLLNRGDLQEAEQILTSALAFNPNSVQAHFSLSSVYLHQKKFLEASAELERVVKLQPELVDAWVTLAAAYLHQGRNTQALDALKKAFALDKNNQDAKNLLQEMIRLKIVG